MENNKTVDVLKVNGMKCHNCAGRVQKELESLAGVCKVTVDLTAKTVRVTYESDQIDIGSMAKAIGNLGHGYEVIKE